jgi:superfamily I DNA/RNA helicase
MKNKSKINFLPKDFTIANDYEERRIICEDLKAMLKTSVGEVKVLFNKLSTDWETLNVETKDWEKNFDNPEFLGLWKEHREIYGYVLRSELVYQFKKMLELGTGITIDGPVEYLIVDEYQDLNKCDLQVIKSIGSHGASIFAAGDDDQSIYGFRYAEPEGIRNFTKDYTDSNQYTISECRRCDKHILEASLNVIRQDARRVRKTIVSISPNNGVVKLLQFKNQDNESKKIAEIIAQLKAQGIPESEIIVLLRNDNNGVFSSEIKKSIALLDIKLNENDSGFGFMNNDSGSKLMAILKYILLPNNSLVIRTLFQFTGGIGQKTFDGIYEMARTKRLTFSQVVEKILKDEIKDIYGTEKIKTALNQYSEVVLKQQKGELNVPEIISFAIGILADAPGDFKERLEQIVAKFEIGTLKSLVDLFDEESSIGSSLDDSINGVRVMSMHKAKGLSAQAVFVVAVEEEYLPGKGNVDEERRLLYVSLTRAKNYLFMTFCNQRTNNQRFSGYLAGGPTNKRTLSRYLQGLPLKSEPGETFNL